MTNDAPAGSGAPPRGPTRPRRPCPSRSGGVAAARVRSCPHRRHRWHGHLARAIAVDDAAILVRPVAVDDTATLVRPVAVDDTATSSAPWPSATARILPGPSCNFSSAAPRHRPPPSTRWGGHKDLRVAPTPRGRRSAAPPVPPRPPRPPRRRGCARPRSSDAAKVGQRHHRRRAVLLSMTASAVTPTSARLGP